MKCPVDGTTLLLAERQGVEIDYCPECRGVWLDRGELDKLVRGADEVEDEHREQRRREERAGPARAQLLPVVVDGRGHDPTDDS